MSSSIPSRSLRARRLALPGIALLSAVALAGCSGTSDAATPTETAAADDVFSQELHDLLPESIQESGVISFGALWETPPVIGADINDPDTPVGIAPDLVALMAPILGVDAEWMNMQWPAQLPGVQAGTVDALFGQVSITAEREQSIVDLVPFQKSSHSLLLPAGNPEDIEKIADMCGMTIAVPVGSNQSATVQAISDAECAADPIQMAEYQGATSAVQALRAGTVDAWFDTTSAQEAVVAADPDVFTSVVIPESEMPTQFGGIAVSKDAPGLSEALAGALKILIEDGSYDAIYEEYGVSSQAITVDELIINPMTGTAPGEVAAS
ncbi:transporter substrate-binding domain-containing protein [Herbiconiux moechotypicola]|uniref:Basic amino acid ABC transporter substrate-binding protein n=1 Tax=Herbiconiux moechotypicola TaxID=637393 RepID=A0ABN3DZS9_9MICO|nr:transporter substrate-binding domain-containing protein [Herbiconiux moechotypicola]MCS5731131.1 transporter substrate-binding domain-containing protein [Herbiconiux moechotypicola]